MYANTSKTLQTLLAVIVIAVGGSAHAAGTLFRSYLSINGSDANACTVSAPCRLLPAALAQTQSGGEVWMLDSANYNSGAVNVTQSVTILAVPGALGSLVANNANAINISTANVAVTLRNLAIRNLTGSSNFGVYVNANGAQLIVERSQFSGLQEAVFISIGGTHITVTDTTFRLNQYNIDLEGDTPSSLVTGVVDRCTIEGAGAAPSGFTYGTYIANASVTISNSTISNLEFGIGVSAGGTVLLDDDVISKNYYGVNSAGTVNSSGNNTLDNSDNVTGSTINTLAQY